MVYKEFCFHIIITPTNAIIICKIILSFLLWLYVMFLLNKSLCSIKSQAILRAVPINAPAINLIASISYLLCLSVSLLYLRYSIPDSCFLLLCSQVEVFVLNVCFVTFLLLVDLFSRIFIHYNQHIITHCKN